MGRRPVQGSREGLVEIDGYVVVDKPAGMTSHDVVASARRLLSTRRIGHGGTLDPGATGVLVLGVGRATRLLRYVSELDKAYEGEIVFGATTTSLDDEGAIVQHFAMDDLSFDQVRQAAVSFIGTTQQTPPMVSAIKVDGTKLYDLARQGIEVERAPRAVTITRFEIEPTDDPLVVRFSVSCSSGTYVRSLADDLGRRLGGGAHLRRLRRTSIGPHHVEGAVDLDNLTREMIAAPGGLVQHLSQVVVADDRVDDLSHGKVLVRREFEISGDGPWAMCASSGALLAVYESWNVERVKPSVVLIDPAVRVGERDPDESTVGQSTNGEPPAGERTGELQSTEGWL